MDMIISLDNKQSAGCITVHVWIGLDTVPDILQRNTGVRYTSK
jgi:hypothetical protein